MRIFSLSNLFSYSNECLVVLLFYGSFESVLAVPTGSNLPLDIAPLDMDIRTEYTLQCHTGGSILLNEETLKKSRFLLGVVNADSTCREITIQGHGCHQETLQMVML
jgi:hypothetical protein